MLRKKPMASLYFGDIIREMRPFHQELEEQFLSLNKLIPYNHNSKEVYSPRLYNLLQGTCAQVIALMQRLADELSLPGAAIKSQGHFQKTFIKYYAKLNKNNLLSKQKLCPRMEVQNTLTPFRLGKNSVPKWWTEYNTSKHNLPFGAYIGTIGNVMNALGALYILHIFSGPIMKGHMAVDILDGNNWRSFSTEFRQSYQRLINSTATDAFIQTADTGGLGNYKSQLFYFLCEFHRN